MNKLTKWFVGIVCAFALVTATFAADTNTVATAKTVPAQTAQAENWLLTLGGVGNTITTSDGDTAFGVDLSIGRTGYLWFPLEAGLRQSVSYSDGDTVLNTRLYSDWTVFSLFDKKVDLFGGVAIGLEYGNIHPSWEIAPEAGLRWWIKNDVAILCRTEVPWNLEEWEFKDNVRYLFGFQVKF